jgi:multimeric flavodoxin WrbA
LVILSRVTFGGYSSKVKYAMDRNVPNILPFFIKHKGEMHHPQRYGRQGLLTLGWQDRSEEMTAGFFAKLAERNSRNMQATVQDSRVLHGGQTAEERREAVETLLRKLEARS